MNKAGTLLRTGFVSFFEQAVLYGELVQVDDDVLSRQ